MSGIAKNYLEAIAKNDPAMAIHLEGFHSLSVPIYVKSEAWPNLEEASTWFIAVDSVREGRELKAWLQKSLFHRLVLVASDLKELAHWLMSSAAADLILSLQVQLLVANGLFEKIETQVRHYLWQSPGFKAAFFDPSHRFQEIERAMLAQAHQRLAVLGEITRYDYWNWPNILRRLMSVEKEKSYYCEKAWKNVPVLICGGGPSVDHLADVLPKARDYFFMISAGTGINVLEGLGVQPHLAMTVDPFRAQFSRFSLIHHLEQAHAAGWRSNYRALSCLSGPRYLLPGSDAYPMTRLWEEALDQDGPILDEGHNVVGMAMAVSKALGARSIGLVGIDLALSEGKLYGAQMTSTEKRWQGYSQLEELPLIIRNDRAIALDSVSLRPENIFFVSDKLLQDRDFLDAVKERCPQALDFAIHALLEGQDYDKALSSREALDLVADKLSEPLQARARALLESTQSLHQTVEADLAP